jgi:hypothetical protein
MAQLPVLGAIHQFRLVYDVQAILPRHVFL